MNTKFVSALAGFGFICCLHAQAVQIIGHRGASFDAPENTLSSFKLGYAQHADGDELDIWLTKDGKIVVMHDGNTFRTSGVSNVIEQSNLEDLRKLDIGKWGKWQGQSFTEKVPLLEEVLAIIPNGKKLVIEIKGGPEIVPELVRVIKASGKKAAQLPIISFKYPSIKAAKAALPDHEAYWLVERDRKTKEYPSVESMIDQAKEAKLDGLDLNYGFPIDKAFVDKIHHAGLKLITWTVDDPEVARQEVAAGVDAITTNRPGWLREQLKATP